MRTPAQRGRIGNWLRDERLARGWSQKLARRNLAAAGIPVAESVLAEWESGTRVPNEANLARLEEFFGPVTESPADATPAGLSPLLERLDQLIEQNAILIRMLVDRAAAEPPERPPSESGPEARSRLTRAARRGGSGGPLDADRYDEPTPIPSTRVASGTGY